MFRLFKKTFDARDTIIRSQKLEIKVLQETLYDVSIRLDTCRKELLTIRAPLHTAN